MSQISCTGYGWLVSVRWFHAGGGLSRPGDINQSATRQSMRSEPQQKCPRHPPGLPSVHTSNRCRTAISPAINLRAGIKSP
jgi:hypothetical protein